jgi:nucleotide-binding universal stress UspA family protein
MSYRSILLYLDEDALCEKRSTFAIELAKAYESHLVGAAPTGFLDFPVAIDAAATLAEYADVAWRAVRIRAERSAQVFRDRCARASLPSFEAVTDESARAGSLVHHSHCSDLVILSQADPSSPEHATEQQLVEEVVLQSSRPTLIVPYAGSFSPLMSDVMVAWDDSREAARAVADAMPLLRRSKRVHVVGWAESHEHEGSLRPRLDAVCRWLQRHGVPATARTDSAIEVGVADAMLSRAADLGTQLTVMGAYGHARWTERVLGGATRSLLTSMTTPVLMSH